MARGRRRFRWFNYHLPRTALASSAGGAVQLLNVLSEAQVEDELLAGGTLVRAIGQAIVSTATGDANCNAFLGLHAGPSQQIYVPANFLGNTALSETVEDQGWLWTQLWGDIGSTFSLQVIQVDMRRKMPLRSGMDVNFYFANIEAVAAGTSDLQIALWLRMLTLLP